MLDHSRHNLSSLLIKYFIIPMWIDALEKNLKKIINKMTTNYDYKYPTYLVCINLKTPHPNVAFYTFFIWYGVMCIQDTLSCKKLRVLLSSNFPGLRECLLSKKLMLIY